VTEETDKEPQEEDFEEYKDYVKAEGRWSARQEFQELQTAETERAEQEEQTEIYNSYCQRADKAREAHDDYDEVVGQDIELPQSAVLAIIELDNGPEIAYHLGQNPEACEKLSGLSQLGAVAEIGRLSASLTETSKGSVKTSAEPARVPNKKPVSAAPTPIKPIGAGSTKTQVALDEEEVSFEEYMRRRDAGER